MSARQLHLGRLRARLGHLGQHLLLLLRVALHRFDQVGNQVGAALILIEHFAPRRLDLLIEGRQLIDAAASGRSGGR